MKILIVNDDGINAEGIRHLVNAAKEYGEVFVVAPMTQQSAVSQGITVHEPIEIKRYQDKFEDVVSYAISGKPADCVKVAIEYLHLDVDLVLSGVNDGPNLGTDILYSGTGAGASEACVFNLPAVSFSTDFGHFDIVEKELKDTLGYVINNDLPKNGTVINVNFPLNQYTESKGIKFTYQGKRIFSAKFRHDNGKYWQEGNWIKVENYEGSDVCAVTDGYISISPIKLDRTDYDYLENLRKK